MSDDAARTGDLPSEDKDFPALFATIHHRGESRPDGFTADEITELNELANGLSPPRR
ncbi:hypothetical protein [Caulobacter sp. S45]|uniref:hypothetical protein n=1 Tax=Caulobacter sp. S45 TaxID=1641861 RepID=UPI00131D0B38|nr:hypothetical protein [Caulobacter sp. S45]